MTDSATATVIPFPRRGPCPVSAETIVRPYFRRHPSDGIDTPIRDDRTYEAGKLRWRKMQGQTGPYAFDIVGYEVVS